MSKLNSEIYAGFITNNAGMDIPGSTVIEGIERCLLTFDRVIIVDGNLTEEAKKLYSRYNRVTVVGNKWSGRHIDQYIVRNSLVPDGCWLLALDCDEIPSNDLQYYIPSICKMADEKNIPIIGLPAKDLWCKHNENSYYEINRGKPTGIAKRILYKVSKDIQFHCSKTGTHVTPYHISNNKIAAVPYPYLHFKSPETMAFNAAICIMDDLYPEGEAPDSPGRGLNMDEVRSLHRIGLDHDLLSKEKFRIVTKNKAWPKELEDLVKTFKNKQGMARCLYTTYFVFLNAVSCCCDILLLD